MSKTLFSVLSAIVLLCLLSCGTQDNNNNKETQSTQTEATFEEIPPYYHADSLREHYSSPPLNYYFTQQYDGKLFSTYSGYVNKKSADDFKNGIQPDQTIEIFFNPQTREIYHAYMSIHNLKTIYLKPEDFKHALQFVDVVAPQAAQQFERNFKRIFSDYLNDTPIDSNKYIDEEKNLIIEIQDDFDFVATGEEDISDAFINISIINLENFRKMK